MIPRRSFTIAIVLLLAALLPGCTRTAISASAPPFDEPTNLPPSAQLAYFAAGCFWCSEEIFQQQPGVIAVTSGYMGGSEKNPNYEQVGSGETEHAESIRVAFDPAKTSYSKLLEVFWHAHDPTQVNGQGPDIGRQYRSAIFYTDEAQREAATTSQAAAQSALKKPIATEITKAGVFYPAEDYHQNYYRKHPRDPYLQQWLIPKLKKLGLQQF